jgi:hypothetical protein
VVTYFDELTVRGYSLEDIVYLASRPSGAAGKVKQAATGKQIERVREVVGLE